MGPYINLIVKSLFPPSVVALLGWEILVLSILLNRVKPKGFLNPYTNKLIFHKNQTHNSTCSASLAEALQKEKENFLLNPLECNFDNI